MSRLPRLIDPQSTWLCGLRAALRRIRERGETLVFVDGTAGSEFVRRGAERLGIVLEKIDADAQLPDQSLMAAAQRVVALAVRTNGNIHRELRERLTREGAVELVSVPGLQTQAVREDLTSLGAALWEPPLPDQAPLLGCLSDVASSRRTASVYEVVPFPATGDWAFLSHTTRACSGPWPGESVVQYVDSILDGLPDADHSATAALERIVRERRLLASSRTIRGGHRVVCFTAVPLMELPRLRQFRTHRARWDFEPFGLCIRRSWLQEHGARPVIYGDESTWSDLSDGDRPYFQLAGQPAADSDQSPHAIDWTTEQEWRHPGDLDLQDLPPDQALIFVPGADAAARLSAVSPWPITLWPDLSQIAS